MSEQSNAIDLSGQLLTVIGVVFVILKLAGVIHWSWWLVTAPFWFPILAGLALVALVMLGSLIWAGIEMLIDAKKGTKR